MKTIKKSYKSLEPALINLINLTISTGDYPSQLSHCWRQANQQTRQQAIEQLTYCLQ